MAEANQIRPAPVSPSDGRLVSTAVLIASGGERIGQATLLSDHIAVTTAEAVTARGNLPPGAYAEVTLLFPQFQGQMGVGPASAIIEGIDSQSGFATLRVISKASPPVPTGLVGSGDPPSMGTSCDVLFVDASWAAFLQLTGQIESQSGDVLLIRLPEDSLDEPAATVLASAPVFVGNQFVGIVVGASSRQGVVTAQVLSVAGMARSTVTPAVRGLLPWVQTDPVQVQSPPVAAATNSRAGSERTSSTRPTEGAAHEVRPLAHQLQDIHDAETAKQPKFGPKQDLGKMIRDTVAPRVEGAVDSPEEGTGTAPDDASVWERMSAASRFALARADAVRRAVGKKQVHTYHLVAGLFPAWDKLFEDAGVSEREFREIVRAKFGAAIPESYTITPLGKLPPRSVNAQHALKEAAERADKRGSKEIWTSDLLLGVLSLRRSTTIRALQERGVGREEIRAEDRSEKMAGLQTAAENDAAADASPSLRSGEAGRTNASAPTQAQPEAAELRSAGQPGAAVPTSSSIAFSPTEIPPGPASVAAPSPRISSEAFALGLSAEVFGRLSPSAKGALERADGMRIAMGLKEVHMEQLMVGLFEKYGGPTQRLLERSKIDEPGLLKLIREVRDTEIPAQYSPVSLNAFPPFSEHAGKAMQAAVRRSAEQRTQLIRSRHLLYGALSVEECGLIKALQEHGVRKEDIYTVLTDDQGAKAPLKPEEGLNGAPSAANPTPKVDSDLWSRKDRLGYEAYARTIAELITHRDTVAPLTIGIKAPWGAGKTSVMKRVQHLLDGDANLSEKNVSSVLQTGQAPQVTLRELLGKLDDRSKPEGILLKASDDGKGYNLPPRITVWFNAWKYQTSEQIWAGMAHCIISQVTARMKAKDRELFWLRLHARRINANEVRKKIYTAVAAHVVPWAAIAMAVTALLIAVGGFALSYWWNLKWAQSPAWQLVSLASGLVTGVVKREKELGEKAADTVKELVREPDYEGKMGYLHLVESDIREVLDLVTTAEEESSDPTENPPLKPSAGLSGAPSGVSAPGEKQVPPVGRNDKLEERVSRNDKVGERVSRNDKREETVKRAPLVVFVDDLDRCAPNKVAEVVEAINLFLCGDYPNCVFVLGMEPGMVAAALEVANKDVIEKALEMGVVDNTAPVGWRFMEKIVQLPITIPPPTKHGRESYVEYLTGVREFHAEMARMERVEVKAPLKPSAGLNGAPEPLSMPIQVAAVVGQGMAEQVKAQQMAEAPLNQQEVKKFEEHLAARSLVEVEEKTKKALEVAAPAERRAVAEASKRVYAKAFTERDPAIREFVDTLGELVDGNPRQIKRYVNVFRFYSTLRHSLQVDGTVPEKELPSAKTLAKFVAMSIQWPHAVDCLRLKKDGGVSRLEFLEGKAREMGDGETADAKWKELVGEKGMGLGRWAETRAFREFLRSGESLGSNTGHGLW